MQQAEKGRRPLAEDNERNETLPTQRERLHQDKVSNTAGGQQVKLKRRLRLNIYWMSRDIQELKAMRQCWNCFRNTKACCFSLLESRKLDNKVTQNNSLQSFTVCQKL